MWYARAEVADSDRTRSHSAQAVAARMRNALAAAVVTFLSRGSEVVRVTGEGANERPGDLGVGEQAKCSSQRGRREGGGGQTKASATGSE
jgi:hypothetical protein